MEENNEVEVEQEVQETQESSTENNSDGPDFDIKSALPILITVIVIIVLFFKMVIPALTPTDHSPSRIIEETQDGEYYDDQVRRLFGE